MDGATEQAEGLSMIELLALAKSGDQAALCEIDRIYRPQVRCYVWSKLGDTSEIEDIVQEAMIHGISRIHSVTRLDSRGRLMAWFFFFARSAIVDYIRWKKRDRRVSLETQAANGSWRAREFRSDDLGFGQFEARCDVYRLLDTLAPKQKAVITFHKLQSRDKYETATLVPTGINSVSSTAIKAMRKMREHVRQAESNVL